MFDIQLKHYSIYYYTLIIISNRVNQHKNNQQKWVNRMYNYSLSKLQFLISGKELILKQNVINHLIKCY